MNHSIVATHMALLGSLVTQRAIYTYKTMLIVTLRDRIRIEQIHRKTKVTNIDQRIAKLLKWQRVAHIAHRADNLS